MIVIINTSVVLVVRTGKLVTNLLVIAVTLLMSGNSNSNSERSRQSHSRSDSARNRYQQ